MSGASRMLIANSMRCNWLGVAFYFGPFLMFCGVYLLLFRFYVPEMDSAASSDSGLIAVRNLVVGLITGLAVAKLGLRQSSVGLGLATIFGVYVFTCLCLHLGATLVDPSASFAKDMGTAMFVLVVVYAARGAYSFVRANDTTRKALSEKEQVEQRALNRRLSPHVLYNTLNAIYAESLTDPEATPELILALSTMLRHITDTSGGDFTNASDELNFIRNLCLITRKRGDERVRIELDFPDETDTQIPRLLCSTLVENAISHGRTNNGSLDITAYFSETEDGFVFFVTNERGNSQAKELDGLGSGIGSISKRLEYLYPDRHRFVCKTLSHGRFHAEIETW